MNNYIKVVGLDVHKKTITLAVLPAGSDRTMGTLTIENNPAAVEKSVRHATSNGPAEFVYEAGPCGYEVQRQITAMGHVCVVVAPGLIPVRPGDRVKTDRRDAEKLARLHRAGELTTIRIPSREEEAARDLPRTREDVLADRLRARNRMSKFLLRQGRVFNETKSWGTAYWTWLRAQNFEWKALEQTFQAYLRTVEEADARLEVMDRQLLDLAQTQAYRTQVQYLRCFKGIDTLSALTIAVEAQEFQRFEKASGFMSYTGAVPSEHSSGGRVKRGRITRVGNAHIRRVLTEAAWSYRYRNTQGAALLKRRVGCPPEVIGIAKKAQDRLHRKFGRMISRNKPSQVAVVAVARELAGFIWAMARHFPAATA
jgi:transposase